MPPSWTFFFFTMSKNVGVSMVLHCDFMFHLATNRLCFFIPSSNQQLSLFLCLLRIHLSRHSALFADPALTLLIFSLPYRSPLIWAIFSFWQDDASRSKLLSLLPVAQSWNAASANIALLSPVWLAETPPGQDNATVRLLQGGADHLPGVGAGGRLPAALLQRV